MGAVQAVVQRGAVLHDDVDDELVIFGDYRGIVTGARLSFLPDCVNLRHRPLCQFEFDAVGGFRIIGGESSSLSSCGGIEVVVRHCCMVRK